MMSTRDLGLMGESTFSLWCGQAGLIANGSRIDRTGWDFLVEFPFETAGDMPVDMQGPAIECKVQIKASDKNSRKISVPLSNLRRLVTVHMPAFFLFIEFNGKDSAQSAFLVHVSNNIITSVLKRLREIEQIEGKCDYNKRSMTIKYDDGDKLAHSNGSSLKQAILSHVNGRMDEYISVKKQFLESTGFENGQFHVTFNTTSQQNFNELIDVSIGLKDEVEVYNVRETRTRFGVSDKNPLGLHNSVKFSMPDLSPTTVGKIRFRENNLSPGLVFEAKLYISPLNRVMPQSLQKVRVDADFFDLVFNPYTGKASYSFSLQEGIRIKVDKFTYALKLLKLLNTSGVRLICDLEFHDKPRTQFEIVTHASRFSYDTELNTTIKAKYLCSYFEISRDAMVSMHELWTQSEGINQLADFLQCDPNKIMIEFSAHGTINENIKYIALHLIGSQLGNYTVAALVSLSGSVCRIEGEQFRFICESSSTERRFAVEAVEGINHSDLVREFELVEEKYKVQDVAVITMFDKRAK